mgnify:CR=1 FL=1
MVHIQLLIILEIGQNKPSFEKGLNSPNTVS